MIKIKVDGIEVEGLQGETILDLAKRAEVHIPVLCHDDRLKPFGACRMCIVEVEGSPKMMTACTTPATDGMNVLTSTEKVNRIRGTLVELLSVYHPIDCPVCDAAGECGLQNYIQLYGRPNNRFKDEKPPKSFDPRSPLIERNFNRCVYCGRCVRICNELQGVGAIGFINRGFETEIAPPYGQQLDCEFCGQCISSCPVGALYSKTFKFKARVWKLHETDSICSYCGTGCSIKLGVYKENGQLVRIKSEVGQGVNNGNLCGKGRFGYEVVHSGNRIVKPLIKRSSKFDEVEWEEASKAVANNFKTFAEQSPSSIGVIGSPRCSNEDNYMLQKLFRGVIGTNNIDSCARFSNYLWNENLEASFGTSYLPSDIKDVKKADVLLVVESNLTETNPVYSIDLMQSARFGESKKLVVISSMGSKLTKYAQKWLRAKAGTNVMVLNGIMKSMVDQNLINDENLKQTEGLAGFKEKLSALTYEQVTSVTGLNKEEIDEAAKIFGEAKNGLITLSMALAENTKGSHTLQSVMNLAILSDNVKEDFIGLHLATEFNNSNGVIEMGVLPDMLPGYISINDPAAEQFKAAWQSEIPAEVGLNASQMIDAILEDKIKALFIMGENPVVNFPDTAKVKQALNKLELLVVQDLYMTETAEMAHIFLPAVSWAEKDGTFTNMEGRVQKFSRGMKTQGLAVADWRILAEIAKELKMDIDYDSAFDITNEIAELVPENIKYKYQNIASKELKVLNENFKLSKRILRPVEYTELSVKVDNEFKYYLLTGNSLFHSGTYTRYSTALNKVDKADWIEISPENAAVEGIIEGDNVIVKSAKSEMKLKAKIAERQMNGYLFVTNHSADTCVNNLTDSKQALSSSLIPVKIEKA